MSSSDAGLLEELRSQLIVGFPLHAHLGLELDGSDGSDGTVGLRLPDDGPTRNHLGTQAAASLFALGDAASGIALIVGLRPHLFEFAGVVSQATMQFLYPSSGPITAIARSRLPPDHIAKELLAGRRVTTEVESTLTDAAGETVCQVTVTWHLRPPSSHMPAIWRRGGASETAG